MDNFAIPKFYYICRICGLDISQFNPEQPPWDPNEIASDDICPCCGVHFGYQDCKLTAIKKYRQKWLDNGALWCEPKEKPENWSLEEQLKNIAKEFL